VDEAVNRILRTPKRATRHVTRRYCDCPAVPQVGHRLSRPISITFSNAWTSLCKFTSAPACQISGVSAHSPEHRHADGWYPFVWRRERGGWTTSMLRDFERAANGQLCVSRGAWQSISERCLEVPALGSGTI
jgi:hypothetical protein